MATINPDGALMIRQSIPSDIIRSCSVIPIAIEAKALAGLRHIRNGLDGHAETRVRLVLYLAAANVADAATCPSNE